jgi:quercetin dioxygenase-like cupin family protein
MDLEVDPEALPGEEGSSPGATGLIRALGGGAEPLLVVEHTTDEREWAPLHRHAWDEVVYVLEGQLDFVSGGACGGGGPGTMQLLPAGRAHTVRVVEGPARFLMIHLASADEDRLAPGTLALDGAALEELLTSAVPGRQAAATAASGMPPGGGRREQLV